MSGIPPIAQKPSGRKGFGTLGGVFTPCTLTILGVIMFLRFGQVVGNAGLIQAIGIVLLSKCITTLTALSLSAIATNTRVEGGGAYFLISRSLGPAFGGSIGLVFFLAQAVSVAMYVLGFTEALRSAVPGLPLDDTSVAVLTNTVVFICVYIGAGWTIKLQYGILALLGASLVAFFAGAFGAWDGGKLADNLAPAASSPGFFAMFALFFPAATGIMAGANMSGDLANPARSIPRGTLGSIAVTGVIYALIAVCLAAASGRQALLEDALVMSDIAVMPILIALGVFAATLSSALGSMMGAPRILQALGRDGVFPRLQPFGKGDGPNNEPRRATVLSYLIALVCILLGDLNAIAPIITMFFLITYGFLNLATVYEYVTRNPSFRPTFRWCHWTTALAGAVGCTLVMFLTSPVWAIASMAVMALLYWYVSRSQLIVTWGDAQSGAAFERARRSLLRLEEDEYHPKNWRPSIIALSGGAWTRVHLAIFGFWLTASRGVLTLAQVITGDTTSHLKRRRHQEAALQSFIAEQELSAFPAVLVAPDRELGIEALVQCYGIGALRPNVVLLGWSEDVDRQDDFASLLRTIAELERSLVVIRQPDTERDPWLPARGPVDVWWRGADNGHLMVLLAHLLVQNDAWRGHELRLLRVVPHEAGVGESARHLERLLALARVKATVKVVVSTNPLAVIHETSARSAAVFLGFRPPAEGQEDAFFASSQALMEGLPTVISVWSAGDAFLDA
ncbi:MAG: amino acid permease [Planctomycetota bacterium]|nr:amino acid permease [Planctomycetota bacterium]